MLFVYVHAYTTINRQCFRILVVIYSKDIKMIIETQLKNDNNQKK